MNVRKALCIALLASLGHTAHAANIWCSGTLSRVWVDVNGIVFYYASFRNQHIAVCDLDAARQGVTPDTCKAWYTSLQTAMAAQQSVTIQYNTDYTCATLPTYGGAPVPRYIMNVSP